MSKPHLSHPSPICAAISWRIAVLLLLIGVNLFVSGQVVRFDEEHIVLGDRVQILEDPTGQLTLAQILSGEVNDRFKDGHQLSYNYSATDSVYWIRFSIHNPESQMKKGVLELTPGWLSHMTLYLEQRDDYEVLAFGADNPFGKKGWRHPNIVHAIDFQPGVRRNLYLRLSSNSEFKWRLDLWTHQAFAENTTRVYFILGLYFGLMFVMVLYNLFIFLSVKDKSYLYYILYIFCFGLFNLSMEGLAYQYLWPHWPYWNSVAGVVLVGMSIFWAVLFTSSFLRVRDSIPVAHWMLMGVGVGGLIAASFFWWYVVALYAAYLMVFCTIIAIITSGVVSLRKNYQPAVFFLTAWGFLLLGCALYLLQSLNLIPSNFLTQRGIYIGSSLEVILLSLGLAGRINQLKKENFEAQENMRVTSKVNRNLEIMVRERTLKLETWGEKLSELNAILDERNHDLDDKNRELQTLVDIIRSINSKTDLKDLFHDLLVQGKHLFPKTEKSLFLYLKQKTFTVGSANGYEDGAFQDLKIREEQLIEAFRRGSLVLDRGVYLPRKKGIRTLCKLLELSKAPQSMLVMALNLESRLVGVLLLTHQESGGFEQSDIGKLERFRQHAVMALARVKLIRQLEVKTAQVMTGLRYTQAQMTLEPVKERMEKARWDHFILNKPKGEVSGDFLWFHQTDNLRFLAMVDSPDQWGAGPFMSMVGFGTLERLVTEKGFTEPSEILTEMECFLHRVAGSGLSLEGEGLGVVVCLVDANSGQLRLASAGRSIYITRDQQIQRVPGENKTLGVGETWSFPTHELQLSHGDCLYLSTVGAQDLRNSEGESFGEQRMVELLNRLQQKKLCRQGDLVWDALTQFQGAALRQKDITLVGVKLDINHGDS